jgi:hypothetical protein
LRALVIEEEEASLRYSALIGIWQVRRLPVALKWGFRIAAGWFRCTLWVRGDRRVTEMRRDGREAVLCGDGH